MQQEILNVTVLDANTFPSRQGARQEEVVSFVRHSLKRRTAFAQLTSTLTSANRRAARRRAAPGAKVARRMVLISHNNNQDFILRLPVVSPPPPAVRVN